MATGRHRIGILLDQPSAANHQVLRGISRFAAHRRDWSLRWRLAANASARALASWKPEGLIQVASDPATGGPATGDGRARPVNHCVIAGAYWAGGAGATVRCDLQAAGRLAFAHVQDLGYRQLACLACSTSPASELLLGFVRAAQEHRIDVDVKLLPAFEESLEGHLAHDPDVAQWIRDLPRPSAMFIACDRLAANVCELIHDVGLSIPDDLALIACGNDDVAARLARPALSTVELPLEQVGFRAAEQLCEIMTGQPAHEIVVSPTRISRRRSSERLAIDDPHVRLALDFIHRNAHRPIRVTDVLYVVDNSRRSLEQRFRKRMGRTIMEEIRRARVHLAIRLLTETSVSVSEVAKLSGLSSATQLGMLVRRYTGKTPLAHRRGACASRFKKGKQDALFAC
jgi:LacI family transcriptional regulator